MLKSTHALQFRFDSIRFDSIREREREIRRYRSWLAAPALRLLDTWAGSPACLRREKTEMLDYLCLFLILDGHTALFFERARE